MNFSKRNKSIVDFLFILALFGAFAITGLFVVLFGARVYEKTVRDMDVNYSKRTSLSYVTEKIRSHDKIDGVEISKRNVDGKGEINVIELRDTIGERSFVTYLYMDEGYLKEFTADASYDFNFDDGTNIVEIKSFDIEQKTDSLYYFDIIDAYDEETSFYVSVYSENGVVNGGRDE